MAGFTDAERAFVAPRPVARVATVQPDGSPHVVPVCPVVDGDRVIFESGAGTGKTKNLSADARISICWDEYLDDWDSLSQVIAFGRVRVLDGAERAHAVSLLKDKYPQFLRQTTIGDDDWVCAVDVERVSSWGL